MTVRGYATGNNVEREPGTITANTGQLCCTATRWIVHEKIRRDVIDAAIARLKQIKIGHGHEPGTEMGPAVIAYGLGGAPQCNLVDEADMPLCAFPPRSISIWTVSRADLDHRRIRTMPDSVSSAATNPPVHGMPRVFPMSALVPRANSAGSRPARVVTAETTGATKLFAGVFWSEPGETGGWSFGSSDPQVKDCPHVGIGEEVYLCLRGRMAVEWEGGTFEFGAGDIVYWPNDRWYRTRVIGDDAVQMFYVMAPPPAWIWSLGQGVSQMGDPLEPTAERL